MDIPSVVIRKLGPVTYDVESTQGRTVKRHIDQIRLRNNTMETTEVPSVTKEDSGVLDNHQYSSVGDNIQHNTVKPTLNLNADTLNVCVIVQIVLYQILMDS